MLIYRNGKVVARAAVDAVVMYARPIGKDQIHECIRRSISHEKVVV